MPFTSQSSGGGRRNVFDVPTPVPPAPEGAAASGRSIFATPRATSAASHRAPAPRSQRQGRVSVTPRARTARAAALVALVCAAAAGLSVLVANDGASKPSTEYQSHGPVVGRPQSAARPANPLPGSRRPRQQPRQRGAARRERHVGRPSERRPRARARPSRTALPRPASAPAAAPPPPLRAPAPSAPELRPAPAPPAPPAAVPNPPPMRPAPAPVPAGAPPQFM
jgi:hypothetical protein